MAMTGASCARRVVLVSDEKTQSSPRAPRRATSCPSAKAGGGKLNRVTPGVVRLRTCRAEQSRAEQSRKRKQELWTAPVRPSHRCKHGQKARTPRQ
eukprot:scaffold831_cov268-Pinguiococcus_pyrenoidosus.AAC.16